MGKISQYYYVKVHIFYHYFTTTLQTMRTLLLNHSALTNQNKKRVAKTLFTIVPATLFIFTFHLPLSDESCFINLDILHD